MEQEADTEHRGLASPLPQHRTSGVYISTWALTYCLALLVNYFTWLPLAFPVKLRDP